MKKTNINIFILGSLFLGCLLLSGRLEGAQIEIKSIPTCKAGYSLYVEGRPFLIKGIIYNPVPIGEGYDFDFFSDESKPWLVDGKLMKEMGINCVRIYSVGKDLEKVRKFIRDMYEQFGIYTIVSDWLSLWNHPGPNYSDKEFRKKEEERILKIVEALKNEKGLLMWVLGNENNYTFSGKIGFWTSPQIEEIQEPYQQITKRAEIYYSFIEDLALAIKAIDKVHPVALGNGELDFLDVASKVCKSIDVLAIIVYRGERFGNLFDNIKTIFDRPVFLSEFGCDSYNAYKNQEDQDIQAKYLLTQWQDLYDHTLFSGNQEGNCIGGAIFEWNDEWWKHNEGYSSDWDIHNKEAGWSQGAYYFDIKAKNNLNMNEEWFGVVSLSEEKENGLNKRVPKKSFYVLKEFFSCLSDTSSHKETNP